MIVERFSLFFFISYTHTSGYSNFRHQNRVVGGKEAYLGLAPHVVSFQVKYPEQTTYMHVCGGVIICNKYILSAAHCTTHIRRLPKRIKAGIMSLDDEGQTVEVQSIFDHPYYDEDDIQNDISILKLKKNLQYNDFVSPTRIHAKEMAPNGTVLLAGWGKTGSKEEPSQKMLYAYIPIVEKEECFRYLAAAGYNVFLHNYLVCAGALSGGVAVCDGDSGGPIVQNNITLGIVSWSPSPCGAVNTSTAYMPPSHYVEWIRKRTKDCEPIFV
ncbi:polyserase-related [Holotrichia oblita]|uniref:Polyserase-related n=1 Tax=Holotrichia oblita TaxID=644536 RepID=A0ACB9SV51_HOLOL|nr:polyserase-related [Holotrichia oblita]